MFFTNLSPSEKESLYEFLLKFISNPSKNVNWNWNQKESKYAEDIDYETLSLDEYKSLRKIVLKREFFFINFSACIGLSYDGLRILKYELEQPNSFFRHKDNNVVEEVINAVAGLSIIPTAALLKIINVVDNKKYAIDSFSLHKNM